MRVKLLLLFIFSVNNKLVPHVETRSRSIRCGGGGGSDLGSAALTTVGEFISCASRSIGINNK